MRGWEKIFHENGNDKQVGIAILISDKIDFKTKVIKKDKEEHFIMIKGLMQEEGITLIGITLIHIYAPDKGAPNYIKQILTDIKGRNGNTITQITSYITAVH